MLWAVLMAGGSGTRFWPESRRSHPKQFLKIFGDKTLLEATAARLPGVIPASRTIVITLKAKRAHTAKLLKKIPARNIFGEPVGRNTAPCAVLAAALIAKRDPDAVIALLPADHRIEKGNAFRRALKAAAKIAASTDYPVTFGIKPDSPHTGYGYLELGPRTGHVHRLQRFHEKPDLATANRFLRSGRFLWNSGMFVWRADALLKAAEKFLPRAARLAKKIAAGKTQSGMDRHWPAMPNISIDYGLMEKLGGRILAMPVQFGWSDVGGWQALAALQVKDRPGTAGNVLLGNVLALESAGNMVKAGGRLVVLLGMKGHLVVDTDDALLICPKEKAESIRVIVRALEKKRLHRYL